VFSGAAVSLPGVIAVEPPRHCEQCGRFAETRPYGFNRSRICFQCGQLDPKATERRMRAYLFGERDKGDRQGDSQ